MQGTRSERNADVIPSDVSITDYKTEVNTHELNCGGCNRVFYADKMTFDGITKAIQEGLDNPFMCDSCLEDYEAFLAGQ